MVGPQILMAAMYSFRQCKNQSFRFRALSRLIDWTWKGQLDHGVRGEASLVPCSLSYPLPTAWSSKIHLYVALFLYMLSPRLICHRART